MGRAAIDRNADGALGRLAGAAVNLEDDAQPVLRPEIGRAEIRRQHLFQQPRLGLVHALGLQDGGDRGVGAHPHLPLLVADAAIGRRRHRLGQDGDVLGGDGDTGSDQRAVVVLGEAAGIEIGECGDRMRGAVEPRRGVAHQLLDVAGALAGRLRQARIGGIEVDHLDGQFGIDIGAVDEIG